jgi:aspartate aminotransferase-like enzyme
VTLWYGLEAALEMILAEGLEARWARVARLAERARGALTELGFRLAADRPVAGVTAAFYPEGAGDELREACRQRGVVFAGGHDAWKGRVLRMSHMGAVDEAMTEAGLEAIGESLAAARRA